MKRRSHQTLEKWRRDRTEAAAAVRRRELRATYPDVAPMAWSNLGPGLLTGAGARALREWLATVRLLVKIKNLPVDD